MQAMSGIDGTCCKLISLNSNYNILTGHYGHSGISALVVYPVG